MHSHAAFDWRPKAQKGSIMEAGEREREREREIYSRGKPSVDEVHSTSLLFACCEWADISL